MKKMLIALLAAMVAVLCAGCQRAAHDLADPAGDYNAPYTAPYGDSNMPFSGSLH